MRAEGVASVTRELRSLDRKAVNELRKQMRARIIPIAKEIAGEVPQQAPLSGMNHNGVTRWTGTPRASVSFTPGKSRGGGTRLLGMKFTGGTRGSGGIGFDYSELAGSSKRPGSQFSKVYERGGFGGQQHRVTGQGRAFNRGIRAFKPIRGKGGYFVFDSALKKHSRIEGMGKVAIAQFMRDATNDLQRLRAR
tara:strand:+ start:66 stop:644 length:579 start_codon:yes stop_codon:yes gene_type:complete